MVDRVRRWSLVPAAGRPGGGATSGLADPAATVAQVCDRIDRLDADIRAFVPEPGRRERLAEAARSAGRRWPSPEARPALYGDPVGIKDVIRVDGLPTGAGSEVPSEVLGGTQAGVVDRLLRAGALVAGKTRTAEFAVSAPAPTRNPHNLRHTPGGSSSGSAVAVAAGIVPLALGTQTIGSVIRPAAYCGVVGFVPTYGRIPVTGVIANASSLDRVGLFAADVASAALAAAALVDPWRAVPPDPEPPVLGVPTGPYLAEAEHEGSGAFQQQVAWLREADFPVTRVPVMTDWDAVTDLLLVINRYELAQAHADWFPNHAASYRTETATAIRQGQAVGRDRYLAALEGRESFRREVASAMAEGGVDVWVAPSATGPAPAGLGSTGNPVMCLPWSLAGLPAVSVPAGKAANGLPLGLQCVAAPGADERLLAWAVAVEAVLSARVP